SRGKWRLPWASWEMSSCGAAMGCSPTSSQSWWTMRCRASLTWCVGPISSRAPDGRSIYSEPSACERPGGKLAKSRRSAALDPSRAAAELLNVLRLLGLSPPVELARAAPGTVLEWAASCWQEQPLPLLREIVL